MGKVGKLAFLLSLLVGVSMLTFLDGRPQRSAVVKSAVNNTAWKDTAAEVSSYADVAKQIIELAVFGAAQNRSYRRLADFTDTIGNRVSGSANLEMAIKYMNKAMMQDGLDVHLEPVKIPHWVRGRESAQMILPRVKNLAILGLGSSVGTPTEGIEAEVLVVQSFEELKRRAGEVSGKIVVFNQPFVSYGETVAYREYGASEASKFGAVATLIRSITPFSINSPHTGWQDYQDGVKRIPTACITIEDADLMWRMVQRGHRITVRLTMAARTLPDADSFNTVAEIKGWQHPEQVNVSNFDMVMESDMGTFSPVALQFTGSVGARKVMEEVVKLLAPLNATKLEMHGEGTDISPWMQAGVPGASLHVADSRYFWFHHTEADTMSVQDPRDMDLCAALWAVVSFVVADLEDMLPR
ncbi:carboxypeptidase Q-like isoform X4 [Nerophis ophidion]|uniref:carboxypeptidase Q-like isoform X4 n=1 Tax=Nerophis ophidion TaxID=159077 RepID=UPI002ADF6D94|nr:carboxypeptidase Q-like isoform X4 [Nerophis ophidion]XP_061771876.1 carboxypeptidase Q-like isoform X4 [Nerophis ophidion]